MSNTASFTFTLSKNTPAVKVGVFEVLNKKLKNVHVVIPPGHKGLAFLQVSTPGSQIVPAIGSGDIYIYGDDKEIDSNPDIEIPGPPYQIVMKGYNLDTFLDHSFIVRVTTE